MKAGEQYLRSSLDRSVRVDVLVYGKPRHGLVEVLDRHDGVRFVRAEKRGAVVKTKRLPRQRPP